MQMTDIHWKDKEPDDEIKEMLGINRSVKPNPKDALHIIRHHFNNVTTREFIENLKKYCPRFFKDMKSRKE